MYLGCSVNGAELQAKSCCHPQLQLSRQGRMKTTSATGLCHNSNIADYPASTETFSAMVSQAELRARRRQDYPYMLEYRTRW